MVLEIAEDIERMLGLNIRWENIELFSALMYLTDNRRKWAFITETHEPLATIRDTCWEGTAQAALRVKELNLLRGRVWPRLADDLAEEVAWDQDVPMGGIRRMGCGMGWGGHQGLWEVWRNLQAENSMCSIFGEWGRHRLGWQSEQAGRERKREISFRKKLRGSEKWVRDPTEPWDLGRNMCHVAGKWINTFQCPFVH